MQRILEMTAMPRVGSDGRVTVVVKDHYLKKLIFISQQDCVAGARICSPTRMTKRHSWWGWFLSLRPCAAINGHEDRDDAVAQGRIEHPYSPEDRGGCRFKSRQRHRHFTCSNYSTNRNAIALASAASRRLRHPLLLNFDCPGRRSLDRSPRRYRSRHTAPYRPKRAVEAMAALAGYNPDR